MDDSGLTKAFPSMGDSGLTKAHPNMDDLEHTVRPVGSSTGWSVSFLGASVCLNLYQPAGLTSESSSSFFFGGGAFSRQGFSM